jgi:hypothetical protein
MASEVLMTISRDEVERARLMSEFKYEIDTQSKIGYARKEGQPTWKDNQRLTSLKKALERRGETVRPARPARAIVRGVDGMAAGYCTCKIYLVSLFCARNIFLTKYLKRP